MPISQMHDPESRVTVISDSPALYRRMTALLDAGGSEMDLAPMVHVADAFTLGRRNAVEPFDF